MQYHKFKATQLFDGYKLRTDNDVLVMKEDGTVENIIPLSDAGDNIQDLEGILSPGFINCHCHLELSHMKGLIPQKTGLVRFVTQVIKNRHLTDQEILTAIEKAEDEMLHNGIVAVGDICNNSLTLPQKLKGRIWYHNFIETSGFLPQVSEERFEQAVNIFREYGRHYSIPVASNSIVPHAPYSVSENLWKKIIYFPGNHLLTIHNQETAAENELFQNGSGEMLELYEELGMDVSFFKAPGKNSLSWFLPKFLRNQQIILVHNVHTTMADLEFEPANFKLFWCLCPNANLYIEGQLPNIPIFEKQEHTIVLGTDSLASNHQLSILEEMRTIQRHFPSIRTEQLLGWATINGAKALQMDNILGSFETGKQPGLVLSHSDLSACRRLI